MLVARFPIFRQRVCHWAPCGAVFYLCRRCDRGQRYCSPRCREKARRLQRRQANRRHQQSPEGRDDHRDRQRDYRQRRKACCGVTDQSSLRPSAGGNLPASPPEEPGKAIPAPDLLPAEPRPTTRWVVCQICGCRGRWINPFSEVKRDFL